VARAWVEVDLGAVFRNAERVAGAVRPARLIVMVKADGYGLGATEVARAVSSLDPYALGVATADEAVALRLGGFEGRIIVFAACAARDAPTLARHGVDAAVLGPSALESLTAAGVPLHLEIDTGMGRAGLDSARVHEWGPRLAALLEQGAHLETVFTHFHSAGHDERATRGQAARFQAALGALARMGVSVPPRHAANSDAISGDRQYHLDLVRPGLYLYGGGRGRGLSTRLPDSEPVACVHARVLEVRDLAPGSSISYGATYVTSGRERIATVGIGYADGLPPGSANRGHVLIGGQRAPIRGTVCMDMIAVDVTGLSGVEPGDVVTVLGRDGGAEISLAELARLEGTIEYRVLTGLGRRLPRVYVAAPTAESTRVVNDFQG